MSIPSTVTQLLATLLLVVPGFVFQAMRIRLIGRSPADVELAGRVLRAIVISTIFALAYLLVLGPAGADVVQRQEDALAHPRLAATMGLLGAFVIPTLVAAVFSFADIRKALKPHVGFRAKAAALMRVSAWTRYDPRPTAWDLAFETAEEGWYVRIKMADGSWFAGYWGASSWASTYPDPHSVFVEAEYQVDSTGKIGAEVTGTKGAVIQCGDAVLVELLKP